MQAVRTRTHTRRHTCETEEGEHPEGVDGEQGQLVGNADDTLHNPYGHSREPQQAEGKLEKQTKTGDTETGNHSSPY